MTPHNARPRVEQYAEEIADNACDLADTARPEAWSTEAKDDVLEAIDTLAGALCALGPDTAKARAPVRAATAGARRQLGLADGEEAGPGPGARGRRPVRRARRGLCPGFKGVRSGS
ncbi:hypothetical protein [Streptomyces graminilatus]|uniref:hypothetical protein n=1 Tax=Streptomyces graminilatus TaxID=1464070 RepID=UPI0006E3FBD5|nr:hypothetical protein [Streptomyces graminilatus]